MNRNCDDGKQAKSKYFILKGKNWQTGWKNTGLEER